MRVRLAYREFTDPFTRFRLARWLYALCWTGTDRPIVLFDRATAWLGIREGHCCRVPLPLSGWWHGFGIGPRVAKSGFGLIPGFPIAAPYGDMTLK